ncbi:MAG TPA: alpha/beta hydrolase [Acidimicrobiales bacterium]|nr:alpha/beta hydrolase [Acidimicrobiales bacterium]
MNVSYGWPCRIRRKLLATLAIVALSTAASACGSTAPSGPGTPDDSEAPAPLSAGGHETVRYCSGESMLLTAPDSSGIRPAVLFVHGGDWMGGNLEETGFIDHLRPALNQAGFVVAAINYRLAPRYKAPAQAVDTACALRYLRAWARPLGIDPHEIGAWGDSAGGQLVSLAATAPRSAGFFVGPYQQQSNRPQAVVDMYGIVDLPAEVRYLRTLQGGDKLAASQIARIIGSASTTEAGEDLVQLSPVTYVSPGDPPFLILQGTADTIAPPSQSEDLAAKLHAAGVPVQLVLVTGGQHGLETPGERPSEPQLVHQVVEWFSGELDGSHGSAG